MGVDLSPVDELELVIAIGVFEGIGLAFLKDVRDEFSVEHEVAVGSFSCDLSDFWVVELDECVALGSVGSFAPHEFDLVDLAELGEVLLDALFDPAVGDVADVDDVGLKGFFSGLESFIFHSI